MRVHLFLSARGEDRKMCSEPRPLISVPEVATWLGCSPKSVWRMLAEDKLAKVKVGARTLVTPESVDDYIARGGVGSLRKSEDA
ncbi:helix-turn-helix domain-containing protein [Nocardioides sp. zg-578]|nr:helix-turn-helix domain-containing protein [Nocardioides marmotae]